MENVLSIAKAAERCKEEGLPLSEKAIRHFVKSGELPAVQTGRKSLIYYPNLIRFLEQGNSQKINGHIKNGQIRKVDDFNGKF